MEQSGLFATDAIRTFLYQCVDESIPIILRLRFSYEIDRTSIQRIKNTQVQ